jgi:hypothetical protein
MSAVVAKRTAMCGSAATSDGSRVLPSTVARSTYAVLTDADCIPKADPVQACPCEMRISWTNTSQVTSRYRSSPSRFPKQRTSSHLHAPSELSLSSIVAFWSLVE